MRILPREPGDRFEPFSSSILENSISDELVRRLGKGTVVASSVNEESGLWVGFLIDGESLKGQAARLASVVSMFRLADGEVRRDTPAASAAPASRPQTKTQAAPAIKAATAAPRAVPKPAPARLPAASPAPAPVAAETAGGDWETF